jgi:hypothetical protein
MPLLEDKSVIPEGFIGNPESHPLDSRFRGNDNPKYVKLTMKHYTRIPSMNGQLFERFGLFKRLKRFKLFNLDHS